MRVFWRIFEHLHEDTRYPHLLLPVLIFPFVVEEKENENKSVYIVFLPCFALVGRMLSTFNFHLSVDSSSSLSSWDKFDYRALEYDPRHRLSESLSVYSMSIHSFVLVVGRLQVIGGWSEWQVFLRVPFGLIFSSSSPFWKSKISASSSESLLFSVLKPSSSSLGSPPLRFPVDRRWEFAKTCRKDGYCSEPLGLLGLRLSLGGPLPFVHLHPGDLAMML